MVRQGIYVSPDNIRANRDAQQDGQDYIELAINCIEEYKVNSECRKDKLVEAIKYLSEEYARDEI